MREQEPTSEGNLTLETERIKWSEYSKMMRELNDIKKRMAQEESYKNAVEDLQKFTLWASMTLQQTISGESPQMLVAELDRAILVAAEESEKKMALAQGLDYTPKPLSD